MYSRYYGITSTSENDTCMWLLDCKEYETWRDDGGLLWIKGKPASGKSTLMRYVFENSKSTGEQTKTKDDQHASTSNQNENFDGKNPEIKGSITLSFFFHGRGSSLQKTMLGFYRTVLFQLLEEQSTQGKKFGELSSLEECFERQCDSRGPPGKSWQWETSQLAQIFRSVLTEVLKDHLVYLYVDALDECGEDDARRLAETFEKMIQQAPIRRYERKIDSSTGQETEERVSRSLHICCSCRNPPLLVKATEKNTFQICVEHHNKHSIQSYVWSQLDESFQADISRMIIDRSDGVFMWVYLVVERVKTLYSRGYSKREIEGSIDKIPRDLVKLYEDILQSMLGNKDSLRLVYWVSYAKLSSEELRWVMFLEANPTVKSLEDYKRARTFTCYCVNFNEKCTCSMMERRIQSLGYGFVEIKKSNGKEVVQFVHQSVYEFFLENDALLRLYNSTSTTTLKNHSQVAKKVKKLMADACARYNKMMEIIGRNSSLGLTDGVWL